MSLDDRIATLAAALSDEKVSVAWNAAKELAKLGPEASSALPALSESLRSSDATTALWARYAIARITGDAAKHLPVLIKALDDRRVFPGMAATALGGLGAEARDAVPRLTELLSPSSHPDNRWSAAFALAQIGPPAAGAVPALAEALDDPDEKLRWYAAFALGEIGPPAAPALPALTRALDDYDDDVRFYAARAVGRIRRPDPLALDQLQKLLEDENDNIRAEVKEAIESITAASAAPNR